MDSTQQFLNEIERFLDRFQMSPTMFGTEAADDHKLVPRLRSGKTVTMQTGDRVRHFMKEYETAAADGKLELFKEKLKEQRQVEKAAKATEGTPAPKRRRRLSETSEGENGAKH